MPEEIELNLIGRVHRQLRKSDGLESLPFSENFIHLWQFLSRLHLEKINSEPDEILDYNWQNLVILDALRYDFFQDLYGSFGKRVTKASASEEFIEKNFSDGDYTDTVYITANPHFEEEIFRKLTGRDISDVFHEVFQTWRTDWNDERGTVMPEDVIRDAKTAEQLFPGKKKIIHFMQPHHPFINFDLAENGFGDILKDDSYSNEWDLAMEGKISHRKVSEAYKNNIRYAVDNALKLLDFLSGKTMLTSDHGNLVGENGLYHHPPGSNVKQLREVPMVELEKLRG